MFHYNGSAMSDIISNINKNINQMCDMEKGYLNKMEPISKSGLYGNGIEMIDSQIVSIKDGLTDFKNITINNKIAVEETENNLFDDVNDVNEVDEVANINDVEEKNFGNNFICKSSDRNFIFRLRQ